MKFEVLLEANLRKQIQVEADTPEDAVRKAIEQSKSIEIVAELAPTWIELTEKANSTGELSMPIVGKCSECGNALIDNVNDDCHQDWPWSFTGKDAYLVCYPCSLPPLQQLAIQ